jgi:hypothetical protein
MTGRAPITAKGGSYTTSTVHFARAGGTEGQLVQACGMGRRQLAYLYQVDDTTPVTCKRCNGLPEAWAA